MTYPTATGQGSTKSFTYTAQNDICKVAAPPPKVAQLQRINEEDPVIFIQLTDVAAFCEEVLPLPG